MVTVVVTGAAGFIGSHTCEQLLAAGHRVVAIDNFRTGHRANLNACSANPNFRLIEADVSDRAEFHPIVADAKPVAIIHLAALVSVVESIENPELNHRLNVEATHVVSEAARLCKVPRVVFASSAAVYGDAADLPLTEATEPRPISPYGAAKLASEAILLGHAASYGFVVRCHRYFNVYGPRQDPSSPYSGVISKFVAALAAGTPPTIFGDGEQTRDFISVHDVAAVNVIAALKPALASGRANISTGKATSINQLASILRHTKADAIPTRYESSRAGDIRHSFGSPARAEQELGFQAQISLEAGLAELVHTS